MSELLKSGSRTPDSSVGAHAAEKKFLRKSVKKAVRMANLGLALVVVFSFVATGCLGHPGGATRNKCPPKPPTIQEFNVTEVIAFHILLLVMSKKL